MLFFTFYGFFAEETWESNIKTLSVLPFPINMSLFLTFQCVLRREIQRCAMPRYQREKMKILNVAFPRVGIEPTTVAFAATPFVSDDLNSVQ